MKELIRHIEVLLLRHSCVIVPGLGGFVAHRVPARYVREENLFLPPHRSIGFNPDLTINDGLLVQSYMQSRNMDYPATLKLIGQEVDEIKEALKENGELELGGIGRFLMKSNGMLEFVPNAAGILSPSLYGLDSCTVKPLSDIVDDNPKVKIPKGGHLTVETSRQPEKKTYTFSINKEVVNYAVAALVAIVFYFCWSSPVVDIGSGGNSTPKYNAAVISVPSLPQTDEHAHNLQKPEQAVNKAAATNAVKETTKVEPKQEVEVEKPYTIVLISRVRKENAEAFVKNLHEEGLAEARVSVTPSMVRVVFGAFDSESSAYNELNRMRGGNKHFKDAWVMKANK